MKRCFIGIKFSVEVVEEVKRIQKELEDDFIGKFVEGGNLHLTLKFLGEINDGRVEEVRKKLRAVSFEEFFGELGNVGVFSERFIRIIWVEVLGKVFSLQKVVDEKLSGLFEKERRFMSHLTIARVKNVKDREAFLKKLKGVEVGKLKFLVDGFYLAESILSSEGPRYRVLECFGLEKV